MLNSSSNRGDGEQFKVPLHIMLNETTNTQRRCTEMASTIQMKVSTPELLWHGGAQEEGKPDPVYSVDYHPIENVLTTSGIDDTEPPNVKGSVRLWKTDSTSDGQEFLIDLSDHGAAVLIARFSPCGKMLASASEKQIVVYVVKEGTTWSTLKEIRDVERIWLKPSVTELFDLQWSPDSKFIIVGAIDAKAEIIRITKRDNLILSGHTNYVQGVAWDPLNAMVVTESSDRSCKVHQLKYKEGSMVKLAPRGHCVIKMNGGYTANPNAENRALNAADFGLASNEAGEVEGAAAGASQGINLFADYSYVPSFFRRLTFTPDGLLLIAPTGIHRTPADKASSSSSAGSSADKAAHRGSAGAKSFCTHIFSRNALTKPCASLVGLEDPSVAVRCCPRLYKLLPSPSSPSGAEALIPGDYRVIFAVVTIKSIFLYDTQHPHPLVKLSGLHYAPINDAAWSSDGNLLTVCSSDGYLTFIRFQPGALGEQLGEAQVPESVRRSHPCMYNYIAPPPPLLPPGAPAAFPSSSASKAQKKGGRSSGGDGESTPRAVPAAASVTTDSQPPSSCSSQSTPLAGIAELSPAAGGIASDKKRRRC